MLFIVEERSVNLGLNINFSWREERSDIEFALETFSGDGSPSNVRLSGAYPATS